MSFRTIRLAALGLLIELFAVGVVYLQFRFLNRVAVYSVLYVWPIDLVIEPRLFAAGLSNRGALFGLFFAILALLNSLKWTGLLLMHKSTHTTITIVLWVLLLLSTVVSFSLQGL